tara:strand:+ start:10842 stop:11432 length:591 start_codon:yes stop_codon:yes gene_type:complete
MSEMERILKSNAVGTLNAYSYERFSIKLDSVTENDYIQQLNAAVSGFLAAATDDKEDGPYNAICLAAIENPLGEIFGEMKSEGSIIQVIARIPKLHKSIPKPLLAGPQGLGCESYVKAAILLHPVFYAIAGGDAGPLPKPGNIVEVDFPSMNNTKYGTYIGLVNDGTEVTPGDEVSAANAFTPDAGVVSLGDMNGQ